MSDGSRSSTEIVPIYGERLYQSLKRVVNRHASWLGLVLLLAAGLAGRGVLSLHEGHLPDVDLFLKWMRGLVEYGLGGFYDSISCNYPPLYMLILRGLGELSSLVDPELSATETLRVVLRIPACLSDVAITLMLYVECRRLYGARAGLIAGTLYFLNPVSLYNSAYWGQIDSIHSALVLWALVALNRQRPAWCGVAIMLALLQKLQAIVFVPLIIFDVYRWKRWRGLNRCMAGAVVAAGVVLAPFVLRGTFQTALTQGYGVVGQYHELSVNAFNLWYLLGPSEAPDESVPAYLVELAAGGGVQVLQDASWLLWLTWRRIAMVVFTLLVALTLTLYSRRYSASSRSLAAGTLGLIFFLFLTEMHERYSYPVMAVLPLWAVSGAWRERTYVLLSVLLLLNLSFVQSVDELGGDIAVLIMVLCCVFLVGLGLSGGGSHTSSQQDDTSESSKVSGDRLETPAPSVVITWFCRLTVLVTLVVMAVGFMIFIKHRQIVRKAEPNVSYLDELKPSVQTQGYGELTLNRSVAGGVIHLGDRYYLRGLGTHAPSTLVYKLPAGYRSFRAVADIDRHFRGSAWFQVYLDRKPAFSTKPLKAEDEPVEINVPIEGAKRLKLVVHPLGSKKGDHADWALARLEK